MKTVIGFFLFLGVSTFGLQQSEIPASAPLATDSAAKDSAAVQGAVVRVENRASRTQGSGFLHRSGLIVTAEHVVAGAKAAEIVIVDNLGGVFPARSLRVNREADIALIEIPPMFVTPLDFEDSPAKRLGTMVAIWGFPSGYAGRNALLSVGYVAGYEDRVTEIAQRRIPRTIVNAAINSGNSGGPIIDIETGRVIAIASAKLAPVPKRITSALEALKTNSSGVTFESVDEDGNRRQLVEGQVVFEILAFLRSQTQLVLGVAVPAREGIELLRREGYR